MPTLESAHRALASIPDLQVTQNEPLAQHTRFGIGGPAGVFASTSSEDAFVAAARAMGGSGVPWTVIGEGSNLVVSDAGYDGVVLRYRGAGIRIEGTRVFVQAGAVLQDLVDATVAAGLRGLQMMTGIPGNVGAAIYGNAGAYGGSMSDLVRTVRYFDGCGIVELDHEGIEFRYRASVFKSRKDWLILSAELEMQSGTAVELKAAADEILATRNRKYPPDMKCAGSIFKNLLFDRLPDVAKAQVPPGVIKGGKVPAAWFLDVTGVKGMRNGGIHVADYHANLIYNAGGGTARELLSVIDELKQRVRERFCLELEEEVQFVGFEARLPGVQSIEQTMRAIDALLAGASDAELHWKPSPHRWCIAEVLAHLWHCEEFCYLPRLEQILRDGNPTLASYDERAADAAGVYRQIHPKEALQRLRELRRQVIEILAVTPASAAARPAQHEEVGAVTLGMMLNQWAFHDLGHIRQIAELIRSQRYYPNMQPWQKNYVINP
jgi:UDP-N-acetylmuramate dehydrogenase